MAVDLTLKSTSITNLNTVPPVANAVGAGAAGELKVVDDFKVIPAALSITSIVRMVRVPTNAKVKSVVLESEAQGAGVVNIGVYHSNATNDGTPPSLQGTVVDVDLFATSVSLASLVTPTEVVNESTNYNLSLRNSPLWSAAGLTSDPGGMFDIALTVVGTDVTTGTGRAGLRVGYIV